MTTPIVLFRKNLQDDGEFDVCREYFPNTVELRSKVPPRSLVIPRFSCLPYYKELEQDLAANRSIIINSYEQHRWIANFEWYEPLKEYTPQSWTDNNFFSAPSNKEYVVKGRTNSKKHQWNKLMFAENKRKALEISGELIQDSMIGEQGIIYREYVPLETYEIGLNCIRFTNEWRFFFYRTNLLCYGYYWSNSEKTDYVVDNECVLFARKIALIISQYVNFVVIDVGKTEDGRWIVVELNDASQSGLSECSPHELYGNLRKILC